MLTYSNWDDSLVSLQQDVQELSSTAVEMMGIACRIIPTETNESLVRILEMEMVADRHFESIRRRCTTLVASVSPLAKDMRVVAAAMSVSTDLERIADEALDLVHAICHSSGVRSCEVKSGLSDMAETASKMVRGAISAFLGSDVAGAEEVGRLDDDVDDAYLKLLYRDGSEMIASPVERMAGVDTIIAAHALERIADHATNIAEWAIFLRTGEFVSLNGSRT